MVAKEESKNVQADTVVQSLAALLRERSHHAAPPYRIAIALTEGGRYLLDPLARAPLERRWVEDASLTILTNARTLIDLAFGAFSLSDPLPEHLFVCAGDPSVLALVTQTLERKNQTSLELRITNVTRGQTT